MSRITFSTVHKRYELGEDRTSLREALASFSGRLMGRRNGNPRQVLWALRGVSFEVAQGEVLGVIGPNGAGKTTILKLISRITRPTFGQVNIQGRVSALIELGAGFHPDLTGRENVFLNAAILGMPLKDVKRQFARIAEFSGLERFLDTPVKRYSSGMYVRLAFAVAAHVPADVLLVDEVLAVGDTQFAQRCLRRIRELKRSGVTIVFVSHNPYLVESICDRCILLADGTVICDGEVRTVLSKYTEWRERTPTRVETHRGAGPFDDSTGVQITAIETRTAAGVPSDVLRHDEAAEIWVHYRATRTIRAPRLYLKIQSTDGTCCMLRTEDYGIALTDLSGRGCIRTRLEQLQLTPGSYGIHAELLEGYDMVVIAEAFSQTFWVPGPEVGREGVFVPRVSWARVEDAEVNSGPDRSFQILTP